LLPFISPERVLTPGTHKGYYYYIIPSRLRRLASFLLRAWQSAAAKPAAKTLLRTTEGGEES